MKGVDRPFDLPHNQQRARGYLIRNGIAGRRDFLLAADHLPDLGSEVLFLQPGECRLSEAGRNDCLSADIRDPTFTKMRVRPARMCFEDFLLVFRRMQIGAKSFLGKGAWHCVHCALSAFTRAFVMCVVDLETLTNAMPMRHLPRYEPAPLRFRPSPNRARRVMRSSGSRSRSGDDRRGCYTSLRHRRAGDRQADSCRRV